MTNAGMELLWSLRKALLDDAALETIIKGRVYDIPLYDSIHPYISIDELTSRDISGTVAIVEEHLFRLKAYSRNGGKAEALKIIHMACDGLSSKIALLNYRLVLFCVEYVEAKVHRDCMTAEATAQIKILTEII